MQRQLGLLFAPPPRPQETLQPQPSTALTPVTVPLLAPPRAELEFLVERAQTYVARGKAPSTRRAYETSYRAFASWCEGRGVAAMPTTAAIVAVYVAALADEGRALNTIERALAGIGHAHREHGHAWSSRREGKPRPSRRRSRKRSFVDSSSLIRNSS